MNETLFIAFGVIFWGHEIKTTKISCTRHGHISRSPRNKLFKFQCKKLKLLRYPAQGTGISIVVRETHYLSFNVKI